MVGSRSGNECEISFALKLKSDGGDALPEKALYSFKGEG